MPRRENSGEYTLDDKPYRGTLIRELRHEKHLSLKLFAQELGIHRASLSKIEVNKALVGAGLLVGIASKVGVPVDKLLEVPVHPRLLIRQSISRVMYTRSLLNIGQQVEEIIIRANLSPDQYKLTRELILDTTRAIVLRVRESKIN